MLPLSDACEFSRELEKELLLDGGERAGEQPRDGDGGVVIAIPL